jgi:hypothetical protein
MVASASQGFAGVSSDEWDGSLGIDRMIHEGRAVEMKLRTNEGNRARGGEFRRETYGIRIPYAPWDIMRREADEGAPIPEPDGNGAVRLALCK